MGRQLKEGKPLKVVFATKVDEETARLLREKCRELGLSESEYLRILIEQSVGKSVGLAQREDKIKREEEELLRRSFKEEVLSPLEESAKEAEAIEKTIDEMVKKRGERFVREALNDSRDNAFKLAQRLEKVKKRVQDIAKKLPKYKHGLDALLYGRALYLVNRTLKTCDRVAAFRAGMGWHEAKEREGESAIVHVYVTEADYNTLQRYTREKGKKAATVVKEAISAISKKEARQALRLVDKVNEPRTKDIKTRLPKSTLEKIDGLAKQLKTTRSTLIYALLLRYIYNVLMLKRA